MFFYVFLMPFLCFLAFFYVFSHSFWCVFDVKNIVILIKKNNEYISKFLDVLLTGFYPTAKITPVIQADLVHGLGLTFACSVLYMVLVCLLVAEIPFLLSLQNESVVNEELKEVTNIIAHLSYPKSKIDTELPNVAQVYLKHACR